VRRNHEHDAFAAVLGLLLAAGLGLAAENSRKTHGLASPRSVRLAKAHWKSTTAISLHGKEILRVVTTVDFFLE
jgi:hypothetical protein